MTRQPWIYSTMLDGIFILSPPFVSLAIILLFPQVFANSQGMSTISWVVLVLMIDVAHVYSTLFRTYFDADTFNAQKNIFITVPLVAFVAGVLLYSISALWFWRVLAYLAVFHFIRQQYGFMRIYSRKENQSVNMRLIDHVTIYTSMLFPVIYWHLHAPRNFSWFIEDDFYFFRSSWLGSASFVVYLTIMLVYLCKEIYLAAIRRLVNIPRNLLVVGTALSWYFGIVYFNGDLAFTLLNVVSHGIPYMALVWVYGKKKWASGVYNRRTWLKHVYSRFGWILFGLVLFILAYVEEGFWDGLVWKDHTHVFKVFSSLPLLSDHTPLALIVPLLSLPQVTHYIIDGYIWKLKTDNSGWKKVVL